MDSLICTIRNYILLTKPGIVLVNILTMIGGFFFATHGSLSVSFLYGPLLGLSCVIASSCVFNNYIDKERDAARERTKHRPLPRREIAEKNAIIYGSLLGLSGVVLLAVFSSFFIMGLSLTGFIIYVIFYSLSSSRSFLVNAVGSISGGVPPVVGYFSARQDVDLGACVLFLILFFWQMPHFLAMRFERQDGTLSSGGERRTLMLFIMLFMISAALPTFFGYTGGIYLAVVTTLGAIWLLLCVQGSLGKAWARKMFHFSLVVITALFLMMIAESVLTHNRVV